MHKRIAQIYAVLVIALNVKTTNLMYVLDLALLLFYAIATLIQLYTLVVL